MPSGPGRQLVPEPPMLEQGEPVLAIAGQVARQAFPAQKGNGSWPLINVSDGLSNTSCPTPAFILRPASMGRRSARNGWRHSVDT